MLLDVMVTVDVDTTDTDIEDMREEILAAAIGELSDHSETAEIEPAEDEYRTKGAQWLQCDYGELRVTANDPYEASVVEQVRADGLAVRVDQAAASMLDVYHSHEGKMMLKTIFYLQPERIDPTLVDPYCEQQE